jgi:hypothetical protein
MNIFLIQINNIIGFVRIQFAQDFSNNKSARWILGKMTEGYLTKHDQSACKRVKW